MYSDVLVDHVFDETSNSKDLYHDVIKQVVISAMQGINGKTFPPVSVKVLGSNCRSSSSLFLGKLPVGRHTQWQGVDLNLELFLWPRKKSSSTLET